MPAADSRAAKHTETMRWDSRDRTFLDAWMDMNHLRVFAKTKPNERLCCRGELGPCSGHHHIALVTTGGSAFPDKTQSPKLSKPAVECACPPGSALGHDSTRAPPAYAPRWNRRQALAILPLVAGGARFIPHPSSFSLAKHAHLRRPPRPQHERPGMEPRHHAAGGRNSPPRDGTHR